MNSKSHRAGFTLVELLIGIIIIGMILAGLSQVLSTILSSYQAAQAGQTSVPEARYALERMVMYVQETDQITAPSTTAGEVLTVSERVSDQYNNKTHAYVPAGDGWLDADNNCDPDNPGSCGLINEGGADPPEYVTFFLDRTDANNGCDATNGCLKEKMPNYNTSQTDDHKAEIIICKNVQEFSCRRLTTVSGNVEIILKVKKGNTAVKLQTTARSRWVE